MRRKLLTIFLCILLSLIVCKMTMAGGYRIVDRGFIKEIYLEEEVSLWKLRRIIEQEIRNASCPPRMRRRIDIEVYVDGEYWTSAVYDPFK